MINYTNYIVQCVKLTTNFLYDRTITFYYIKIKLKSY